MLSRLCDILSDVLSSPYNTREKEIFMKLSQSFSAHDEMRWWDNLSSWVSFRSLKEKANLYFFHNFLVRCRSVCNRRPNFIILTTSCIRYPIQTSFTYLSRSESKTKLRKSLAVMMLKIASQSNNFSTSEIVYLLVENINSWKLLSDIELFR